MIISIGSDHGGFELKQQVIDFLKGEGYEVLDEGTFALDSCDYPEYAKLVSQDVLKKQADFGVLICTTGEGISMAANRYKGIRCGIAYNDDVTAKIRAHNNANIIAFGAKYTTIEEAKKRIKIFIETPFEGGRHQRRVDKIEL